MLFHMVSWRCRIWSKTWFWYNKYSCDYWVVCFDRPVIDSHKRVTREVHWKWLESNGGFLVNYNTCKKFYAWFKLMGMFLKICFVFLFFLFLFFVLFASLFCFLYVVKCTLPDFYDQLYGSYIPQIYCCGGMLYRSNCVMELLHGTL